MKTIPVKSSSRWFKSYTLFSAYHKVCASQGFVEQAKHWPLRVYIYLICAVSIHIYSIQIRKLVITLFCEPFVVLFHARPTVSLYPLSTINHICLPLWLKKMYITMKYSPQIPKYLHMPIIYVSMKYLQQIPQYNHIIKSHNCIGHIDSKFFFLRFTHLL